MPSRRVGTRGIYICLVDLEPFPKKRLTDHARSVAVEGSAGGVPFVGAALANFISAAVEPAFDRRKARWFAALDDVLHEIDQRVDSLEELSGDEEFMSALASATRVALGTHLEEKLQWLQAILLGVATAPSRDLRSIHYLYLVDELEPEHVDALRVIVEVWDAQPPQEKRDWGQETAAATAVKDLFDGDGEVALSALTRLASKGLIQDLTREEKIDTSHLSLYAIVGPTEHARAFLLFLRLV